MKLLVLTLVATAAVAIVYQGLSTAQTPCLPTIDHAEFIQVVQEGLGTDPEREPHLFGTPQPPGVNLIASRPVAVRLYVEPDSCDELTGIDAEFHVKYTGGLVAASRSTNGPITIRSAPWWDRGTEDSTINFTAMVPYTTNDIEFSAHVFNASSAPPPWPTQGPQFWRSNPEFVRIDLPRVIGVPIVHKDLKLVAEEHEAARTAARLWKPMWPFSLDGPGGYTYKPEISFVWEPAEITLDTVEGDLLPRLNDLMCGVREANAESIFGWMPSVSMEGVGFAGQGLETFRAAMASSNPMSSEVGFAHENGHLYLGGVHSAQFLDEVGWDPQGKFPIAAHSEIPVEFHGKKYIKPYGEAFSLMVMGWPGNVAVWNSLNAVYKEVANRGTAFMFPSRCDYVWASPPYPYPEPIFSVSGAVPLSTAEPATLGRTYARSRPVTYEPGFSGDVTLRAKNSSGDITYVTKFDSSPTTTTYFVKTIPAISQTHSIEIVRGGVVESSMTRTANTPLVTVTSPISNSTVTSTLTVDWQATDADSDELRTYMNISKDDGMTWEPIAYNISTTLTNSLVISATGIPSGNLLLEILVSDGFNTSATVVSPLIVTENRKPDVLIDFPIHGSSVRENTNIVLTGSAYDREDGMLSGGALRWILGGSAIAEGKIINVNVDTIGAPGIRSLSLVAEDSMGSLITETIQITVTAR